jgi:hypothetical protein
LPMYISQCVFLLIAKPIASYAIVTVLSASLNLTSAFLIHPTALSDLIPLIDREVKASRTDPILK